MATFEPNQAGIDALFEDISAKISETVSSTVRETIDEDVDSAVAILRQRLGAIGLEVDDDWCRHAIETMRRGDDLVIDIS